MTADEYCTELLPYVWKKGWCFSDFLTGDPDVISTVQSREDVNHLEAWANTENLQLLNLMWGIFIYITQRQFAKIVISLLWPCSSLYWCQLWCYTFRLRFHDNHRLWHGKCWNLKIYLVAGSRYLKCALYRAPLC